MSGWPRRGGWREGADPGPSGGRPARHRPRGGWHAIYDRIGVKGRSIVAARLTPAAYSNGLALALPQVVMARPEGSEHSLPIIVIEGVEALVEALRAA